MVAVLKRLFLKKEKRKLDIKNNSLENFLSSFKDQDGPLLIIANDKIESYIKKTKTFKDLKKFTKINFIKSNDPKTITKDIENILT